MKRILIFLLLAASVLGVELNATKITNNGTLVQLGGTQNPVAAFSVAHQINVGKSDQSETVTASTGVPYTLSGTPPVGFRFGFTLTANSGGPYTVTLPTGVTWKAEVNGQTITTFSIPASQTLHLQGYYDGTNYYLSGEPEPVGDGDLANSGKPPPLLVFTTNQTLSGEKSQTANGVTTTTSSSDVLTVGQTTTSENGFWTTGSGAWTRPVYYSHGSPSQCPVKVCSSDPTRLGTYAGTTWRTVNTSTVTIDTTGTAWTLSSLNLTDPGNTTGTLPSSRLGAAITTVGGPGFHADGTIVTGKTNGYVVCKYAGTISGWSMAVDAGTATVKVWKIAAGTAVPTIANVINTSGVAISSGTMIQSTTVSDFTSTTVTAGDTFAFAITAVSGVSNMDFQLTITK